MKKSNIKQIKELVKNLEYCLVALQATDATSNANYLYCVTEDAIDVLNKLQYIAEEELDND